MKKKIVFVIDSLQVGGAEKSLFEIVTRLSPDIEPIVVVIYNNLKLKHLFDDAGVHQEIFGLTGKYEWRKAKKLFLQLCKREKPDLVVATLYRSEIISRTVCHKLGIRHIGTFVNDNYSTYARADWSWSLSIKKTYFWLLNRWTARYCYRFLANSESIKINNAKNLGISPEKIDVIYRGRNVNRFFFQVDDRLKKKNFRLLNVGRLLKRKGQLELVEAFARFTQIYPEATLTIAGEGELRPQLEAMVKLHQLEGKVFFPGNVSNIPELLEECDLFVFPSWYEGFSGALVEAMLAGAPIVASNIDMNTEAVEDGKTAHLFQVQNVDSLLKSLKYAVQNPEEMKIMAKKARKEAEIKYNIEKVALEHSQLYLHYINN